MALNFPGNVTGLEKSVQDAVNRINRRGGLNLRINDRSFTQPLGRITQKANEFTKSLEASNARVIAFGASVGVLNLVKNAFESLVTSVIRVEKALTDINVVLNANAADLDKFGKGLFQVARNTAQTFDVVATAATELARQGLSVEETLKRTNDALILTRLTGMNSAEAVKNLTAAMNTFNQAGLTSTQVVSKMAAVDVEFAVSADDLAAAISRTGQSAQEAGVSIDQLIGIVTAAQQKTARGGAVIGNSFKTIFTRIRRPETLNQLEQLGIAVRDVEFNTLPAIQILNNLAKTYDTLSDAQKSQIGQSVAGVFQINILKAALADAASQNSILARATQISSNATDEAIVKNEKLNETIAALATRTSIGLLDLSKSIGNIALAPGIKSVLEFVNAMVDGLNKLTTGESAGAKFFQGFLSGLGQIATGPGLVLFVGILGKLFKNAFKFASQSIRDILGIQTQAQKLRAIEESIVGVLQRNSAISKELVALEGNRAAQEAVVLNLIKQQTAAMSAQQGLARGIAPGLARAGVQGDLTQRTGGRRGFSKGGYVPNFAAPRSGLTGRARRTDSQLTGMDIGSLKGRPTGTGTKTSPLDVASQGFYLLTPQIGKQPSIVTGKGGKNLPYVNFFTTGINRNKIKGAPLKGKPKALIGNSISKNVFKSTADYVNTIQPSSVARKVTVSEMESGFRSTPGAPGALKAVVGSAFEVGLTTALDYQAALREKGGDFDVRGGFGLDRLSELFNLRVPLRIGDFKVSTSAGNIASFAKKVGLEKAAGFTVGAPRTKASGKASASDIVARNQPTLQRRRGFSKGGVVPNFSPLGDAVSREMSAGVPASAIRVGSSSSLVSAGNPGGLGVYNTIHEPAGLGQGIRRSVSEGRNPKTYGVPNFANGDPFLGASPRQSRQAAARQIQSTQQNTRQLGNVGRGLDSVAFGLTTLAFLLPSAIEGIGSAVGASQEQTSRLSGAAATGLTAGLTTSFAAPALVKGIGKLAPNLLKFIPQVRVLSLAFGAAAAAVSFFGKKTEEVSRTQEQNTRDLTSSFNILRGQQGLSEAFLRPTNTGNAMSTSAFDRITFQQDRAAIAARALTEARSRRMSSSLTAGDAQKFIDKQQADIIAASTEINQQRSGIVQNLRTILPENFERNIVQPDGSVLNINREQFLERLTNLSVAEPAQFDKELNALKQAALDQSKQLKEQEQKRGVLFNSELEALRASNEAQARLNKLTQQRALASGTFLAQQDLNRSIAIRGRGETSALRITQGFDLQAQALRGSEQVFEAEQKSLEQLRGILKGRVDQKELIDIDVKIAQGEIQTREQLLAAVQGTTLTTQAQKTIIDAENKKIEESIKNIAATNAIELRIAAEKQKTELLQKQYSNTLQGGIDNVLGRVRTDLEGIGASFGENTTTAFLNNLEQSLNDVATGSKNAKDAFVGFARGVFNEVQRMLTRRMALQITESLFSGGGRGSSILGGLGRMLGFNKGGMVPAMVMGGEYVINKNAVNKIGVGNLEAINRGAAPMNFANGGRVSSRLLANPDPEMSSIFGLRTQKRRQDAQYRAQLAAFKKQRRRAAIGAFLNTFVSMGVNNIAGGGSFFNRAPTVADTLPGPEMFNTIRGGNLSNAPASSMQFVPASNFGVRDVNFSSPTYRPFMRTPTYAGGGMIRGGSGVRDDIPTVLQSGEFVMRKSAVQKYGRGFMDRLNSGMAEGGPVGNSSASSQISSPSSSSPNVTINVNLSQEGGESANVSTTSQTGEEAQQNREFAQKIKSVVMQVIREEQRVGGTLNKKNPGQ